MSEKVCPLLITMSPTVNHRVWRYTHRRQTVIEGPVHHAIYYFHILGAKNYFQQNKTICIILIEDHPGIIFFRLGQAFKEKTFIQILHDRQSMRNKG